MSIAYKNITEIIFIQAARVTDMQGAILSKYVFYLVSSVATKPALRLCSHVFCL
jgi:hypothetical protein